MMKSHKKMPIPPKVEKPKRIISRRGWRVIFLGIALVIIGFVILSFASPDAQNWAGKLSPFVILGGYATIGVGIVLPDREEKNQ
jgi:uncharacterized membrane protein